MVAGHRLRTDVFIRIGFAGLLDLGYMAFYAVGAYIFALLASPHLTETFPAVAAMFPDGLHSPWWVIILLGAVLAGAAGVLLGAPMLKLLRSSPSVRSARRRGPPLSDRHPSPRRRYNLPR
jgi:MFS family permease